MTSVTRKICNHSYSFVSRAATTVTADAAAAIIQYVIISFRNQDLFAPMVWVDSMAHSIWIHFIFRFILSDSTGYQEHIIKIEWNNSAWTEAYVSNFRAKPPSTQLNIFHWSDCTWNALDLLHKWQTHSNFFLNESLKWPTCMVSGNQLFFSIHPFSKWKKKNCLHFHRPYIVTLIVNARSRKQQLGWSAYISESFARHIVIINHSYKVISFIIAT